MPIHLIHAPPFLHDEFDTAKGIDIRQWIAIGQDDVREPPAPAPQYCDGGCLADEHLLYRHR
jgi:hypothetical protein